MADAIRLTPGLASRIAAAGQAVKVCTPAMSGGGGFVLNPVSAADQGLAHAAFLYVSIVRPPGVADTGPDVAALAPGERFDVPPYSSLWANAASAGHAFVGVFTTVPVDYPPRPVPGAFPPAGPVGAIKTLPARLYKQYEDDDDLQAFFAAYNAMQQDFVDTFNALNLPIYTGPMIAGALADWVMRGLYGFRRPVLYVQQSTPIGPLNTWTPNTIALNAIFFPRPQGAVVSNDDLYKRCLTWHYMKGDGRYFNIRWLKRRVARFCYGDSGASPHIDQTNQISVTFGPNYECTIRFVLIERTVTGGAIPNMFGPNGTAPGRKMGGAGLNMIFSVAVTFPPLPNMDWFKEAVATGVLELPFQFTYVVVIG